MRLSHCECRKSEAASESGIPASREPSSAIINWNKNGFKFKCKKQLRTSDSRVASALIKFLSNLAIALDTTACTHSSDHL